MNVLSDLCRRFPVASFHLSKTCTGRVVYNRSILSYTHVNKALTASSRIYARRGLTTLIIRRVSVEGDSNMSISQSPKSDLVLEP